MDRIRHYWGFIQGSLWFVPLLMSAAAVALAITLLTYGGGVVDDKSSYWLLYTGDAENARELLSALLSGMISMTSLIVSITMVVLTLAAGQIGPRLIRSFIQDRVTQVVLGLFVADILYLLVVFRTIDNGDNSVPHLAVSTGTGVTALCLLVLLFYVHKLARSIIYDTVVRNVAAELRGTVHRLLPEGRRVEPPPPDLGKDLAWISLGGDGYIQSIDFDELITIACEADALIRLEVRPGHFVFREGEHIAVHPAAARTEEVCRRVRSALVVGSERTPTQDIEFGIRQLVEIATRALSPGLNDVFTALAVIDNLSAALADIFGRGLEPTVYCDPSGKVRLVRTVSDYEGIVGAAFDQIRQSGGSNPAVLIHLAEAVGRLSPAIRAEAQRRPLLDQLDMILTAGEQNITIPQDLNVLRERARVARDLLRGRA